MSIDLPFPSSGPIPTWKPDEDDTDIMFRADVPRTWRLNPGSAQIPWDCTMHGIVSRCGGGCCWVTGFPAGGRRPWPPSCGGESLHCAHLDLETGCTMGDARPITCHLYPLILNEHGTLMPDPYTRWRHVACRGNRRPTDQADAPLLIDSLRPGIVAIFGQVQWAEARAATVDRNKPYDFYLDNSAYRKLRWHVGQMLNNDIPTPPPDDWQVS